SAVEVSHSHEIVNLIVPITTPLGMRSVYVRSAGTNRTSVFHRVAPRLDASSWYTPNRSTEGGDLMVINGVGFNEVTGLTIDGAPATLAAVTQNQILAVTPPGAGVMRVIELETEFITQRVTPNFHYDRPTIDGVTVV